MNKLETEIKDFIVNNDIDDYEIKDLAKHFYVSRSLVYKVLNKMGYRSLSSFKYEKNINKLMYDIYSNKYIKTENKYTEEMVLAIISAQLVLASYSKESEIAASYFISQLKNIGIIAVMVDDRTDLTAYRNITKVEQTIIYISNTGNDIVRYKQMDELFTNCIVITRSNSKLAFTADKCIEFENLVTKLSDKFEVENTALLILQLQSILDKVRRHNQNKIIEEKKNE